MADMHGQVALVTGGIRGIGLAICERLMNRGVTVAAGYASNADAAQQFIPAYRTRHDHDGLRGFLRGGRWLCVAFGTSAGALLAGTVMIFAGRIAPYYLLPFMIASLTGDGVDTLRGRLEKSKI